MADRHHRDLANKDTSASEAVANAKSGDGTSAKLAKKADAVGNEEIQAQLKSSGAKRDDLLKAIADRLAVMRKVQLEEIKLMHRPSEWKGNVASAQWGHPEPNKWREPAKLYKEAAHYLSVGYLSRGKELLERATHAEQHCFEELTELIDVPENEKEAIESALGELGEGACAPADLPPEIDLARLIMNVEMELDVTWVGPREADPWWTEEEEEEEEKPDGAGGGGG